MKKILSLLVVLAVIVSCSKDKTAIPDPNNAPAVSEVPENFEQKVLIEAFTKTSCGECPLADLWLDSLVRNNPDRVYAVSFHIDDVMSDTSLNLDFSGRNYYDSLFNPAQIYPSGMMNRHLSSLNDLDPTQWGGRVIPMLSQVPSCGVAIEAERIVGSTLKMTVHVGFSADLFGQYRIHAYLVKNTVQSGDSMYDQLNDFSSEGATPDTTLPLWQLNDTIHGYVHRYVLQKVVTPGGVEGSIIPESSALKGNDYTLEIDVDLSNVNTANSFIVVFVDKYATTLTGHWIENVQIVPIGESKDWN